VCAGVLALEEALALAVDNDAVLVAVDAVGAPLELGGLAVDQGHVGAAPLADGVGAGASTVMSIASPVLYRLPRTFIAS